MDGRVRLYYIVAMLRAEANTIYKGRILDYHVTEKEHQLNLFVNKNVDEGQHFTCQVRLILDLPFPKKCCIKNWKLATNCLLAFHKALNFDLTGNS